MSESLGLGRGAVRRVAWAWVVAVTVLLTGASCGRRAAAAAGAAPAVPVVAEAAARRTVRREINAIGNVQTIDTVSVRPQVGGEIVAVHFREGTDVRAGDVLFEIDSRPYEAALHQAEAALARDEAGARNGRLEAERADALFTQGVLSREQYDATRNSADALDATVRADHAAIEVARLNLGYCRIHRRSTVAPGACSSSGGTSSRRSTVGPWSSSTGSTPSSCRSPSRSVAWAS